MAQFKGTLTGTTGTVTRLGGKANGMAASLKGWTAGVRVVAKHRDGEDCFDVYATGGSNSGSGETFLGTIAQDQTWHPAEPPQE